MTNAGALDAKAIKLVRGAFAKRMLAAGGVKDDAPLERAFATTPREDFLGPGPWLLSRGIGYESVPPDPVLAYHDVLIALLAEKGINNGSPSLHANWLHAANVKPGETVAHIGAGAGYYSAILAKLVGARGRVLAVEFEPELAEMARRCLAARPNVRVVEGDGAIWPREPCDLVYVNFAVDRPAPLWLEQLKPNGRLIFPLGSIARKAGSGRTFGVGLRVERVGEKGVFAAKSLGGAYFVRAEGDGPLIAGAAEREALLTAFEQGGIERVRSLRWGLPPSSDRAWFVGEGWSLGFDEP